MMSANDTSIEKAPLHLSALAKRVIVVFCSIHGAILLISIFPINTAPHSTLLPALKPYHELTGASQHWAMFRTIPQMHTMSAKMKVEYPDGRVDEEGPFIPNAKVIRLPDRMRYFHVMNKVIFDDRNAKFRDAWQAQIAERVEQDGGRSFEVIFETQATRNLFHIAKDGKLSKTLFYRFGTYGVSRENY